jgi:hypothetical protein
MKLDMMKKNLLMSKKMKLIEDLLTGGDNMLRIVCQVEG